MHLRHAALAASILLAAAAAPVAQSTSTRTTYLMPPKVVVDILDAAPTPGVIVSPDRKTIALTHRRSMLTIAELSQPIERLAGYRINPRTNGPQQVSGSTFGITLKAIADGAERKVAVPPNANLSAISFSPDGSRLAFVNTTDTAMELWVADTTTGQTKALAAGERLNGTAGSPCSWLEDSATLLCGFVPDGRGAVPVGSRVPTGPNVQENYGIAAPQPTVQDLLKTEHDEALLDHYFTSQLAFVDVASGRRTPVGKPGIVFARDMSPSGEYLFVARVDRPYSRLVSLFGFPMSYEVWTRTGEVVKQIFDRPSTEGVPINGVPKGPRAITWRRDQPATLFWSEALDEGDLRNKVPQRDKVMTLAAPFTGTQTELAKTEWRYTGLWITEKGVMLLGESDRETRRVRTWILEAGEPPRKLWERRWQDEYGNPGVPLVTRRLGGAKPGPPGLVLQNGDEIYLSGQGASPEGDRPFLDRLNLRTLKTERLFRADARTLESIAAPLDNDMRSLLTLYQSPVDPPNYVVRDLAAGTKKAMTSFKDSAPQFAGVERQFVTYKRKDGIDLNATLYLPPGYKMGERVPVVMWAYPTEYTDPADASQVVGSPYRFTRPGGSSHLFLLLQGYAIFDDPKMPIVGPGETANDTYVDQLVASAEAAVDKVVDMGVGDRDRIGIGGHSYGAFMTANLLAHSDLFRAGIARSGAYNRTLTPFGFQAERRTFWEAPDIYGRMSPFFHANKIKEPILLTHGEMDNNSGTFPIQSERLYMALKGHGANVRYVTLPYEAHGYSARESVLHTLAEMINWMDKYVKNAPPRPTTSAAGR
jgi:dipeptidyl aminopeptidase/acylaminoacyl peptidase